MGFFCFHRCHGTADPESFRANVRLLKRSRKNKLASIDAFEFLAFFFWITEKVCVRLLSYVRFDYELFTYAVHEDHLWGTWSTLTKYITFFISFQSCISKKKKAFCASLVVVNEAFHREVKVSHSHSFTTDNSERHSALAALSVYLWTVNSTALFNCHCTQKDGFEGCWLNQNLI